MNTALFKQKLEKGKAIDYAISEPEFFSSLFSEVEMQEEGFYEQSLYATSKWLDLAQIQAASSYRNRFFAKETAKKLFNEKGRFIEEKFPELLQELKNNLYLIGPGCSDDAARREHLYFCLARLGEDRDLRRKIEQINLPVSNFVAIKMIRESLDLSEKEPIENRHARISITSAFFTYLRQSVGSCFATAPAINIQRFEPNQFIKDLDDLITFGQIKRVIGGNEFAIPLSHSYGMGDLKRQVYFREGNFSSPIWHLPSFHRGLERLGFIDSKKSFKSNSEWIKKHLEKGIQENFKEEEGAFSIDQLLAWLLMPLYSVTQKEIDQEKLKPKPMMIAQGIAAPTDAKEGKRQKGIDQYQAAYSFLKGIFLNEVDHPLLKAWEYTLASFSESFTQFTSWNLYSSLGLDANEPGGIGSCIYDAIEQRYNQAKLDKDHYTAEYDAMFLQVKSTEAKMRVVKNKDEADWLSREYKRRVQEMNYRLELRDQADRRLHKLSNLYNYLIQIFYTEFKVYFQEVYDAEMHDIQGSIYDDSPAGFRLLYKFGRANPSQWEFVREPRQYQEYLAQFFKSLDFELGNREELADLKDDITTILSQVITIVQTDDFLITSLYRMGKAHGIQIPKDPLQHLDKIPKKPWVYTSGGSMDNLVSIYYQKEGKPTQRSRFVEDPKELLAFCIDSVRILDEKERQRYLKNPDLGLLMFSPTHAFRLLPGLKPFCESWQDEGYAYTWISERYEAPCRLFLNQMIFDRDMTEYVVQRIGKQLPDPYRDAFRPRGTVPAKLSLIGLKDFLIDLGTIKGNKTIFSRDVLNQFFYESFPLIPDNRVENALERIISSLPIAQELKEIATPLYLQLRKSRFYQPFLTSKDLYHLISALVLLLVEKPTLPFDLKKAIIEEMRERDLAMPKPLIFADTNWTSDYFAFLLNPTTFHIDFWRVSRTGREGSSMLMWKQWLDGSQKKTDWGVYYRPQEYRTEEI